MVFARLLARPALAVVLVAASAGCEALGLTDGSSMPQDMATPPSGNLDLAMTGTPADLTGVPPTPDLTSGSGSMLASIGFHDTRKSAKEVKCQDSGITGLAITLKDEKTGAKMTTALKCAAEKAFVEGQVGKPTPNGPFTVNAITEGKLIAVSMEYMGIAGDAPSISFTMYVYGQDGGI